MPDARVLAAQSLSGLEPGFYYQKLDDSRFMVIEIFRGWVKDGQPPVSGFYKKIYNSEEDAVKWLIERGCPARNLQEGGCSQVSQESPATQQEPPGSLTPETHTESLPFLQA